MERAEHMRWRLVSVQKMSTGSETEVKLFPENKLDPMVLIIYPITLSIAAFLALLTNLIPPP